MSITGTMVKMANLSLILEAARLLYDLGLSTEEPNAVVKRYVQANPDINELLSKVKQ